MTQIRPKIKFFLRTSAIVNNMEEHYPQKDLVFGNVGNCTAYITNFNCLSECPDLVYHHPKDKIRDSRNIYQKKDWDLNYEIDLPTDSKSFRARIEYKHAQEDYVKIPKTEYCICIELYHKKTGWEIIKERETQIKKHRWIFPVRTFNRCKDCYLRGD